MNDAETVGPLQILLVGFETTERFRGDIVREIADLRGRGMIRVLEARMFHRHVEGKLTEIDLSELLAGPPTPQNRAIAHLLGANGSGNGTSGTAEAFARTAGFALEDLRRLTDQIGPGDYAAAVLVEHLWAARLRQTIRAAGGRLLGQGFLTPEVIMLVGAELQARADAEAAIELAKATRGAKLVEALENVGSGEGSLHDRTLGAAKVVRVLVEAGLLDAGETEAAVDALVLAGLLESAVVNAALAEAEDWLEDS
jgi:hypothetical protein